MVGQTIGKYRIVQRLGRGGMGTVYKAVDETLDRDVAIKVLNPDLGDSELLKRFRAEALTLARLNHPNIATLYELTRQDDELLMVMEFVRGEPLDKLSDRTGPMPFERASYLCGQVLNALAHAHQAGVVHRDLKPANIMLADTGVVKVMDFGIARMAGTEHLTTDGFMMGTPAYMAPEQVMGHDVDGRADLYSVGVVLYRLLTSNLPFKADTAIAMVQKQIKDPPTPLRQFRAELPVWCEQLLDRALAKAPGDRYQTAEEFRLALTRSAALAPAAEVTSVLAASAVSSELEVTVAPDTVPVPIAMRPPPAIVQPASASPRPEPVAAPREPVAPRSSYAVVAAVTVLVLFTILAAAAVMWRRAALPVREGPAAVSTQPATDARPEPVATPAPPPAADASAAKPSAPPAGAGDLPAGRRAGGSGRKPTDPALPAPTKFPPLGFSSVRLLIFSTANPRERDVQLSLGETAVGVAASDGSAADAKSLPYQSVIAIFQSRSREPQWVGPNGVVLPVIRIDGGAFGFLKGDRDWLTIRTKSEFVPLRMEADTLKRVAAALEARTGLSVVRAERLRSRD